MAFEFTNGNFNEKVVLNNGVVLVDFWAEWCGPCRMIGPMIEEIAKDFEGKALVGKLNVDENRETSSFYYVQSIPTLLIFKNGQVMDKIVGAVSKKVLTDKLNSYI